MINEIVFCRLSQKAQVILDVLPSIFGTAGGKIAVENRDQDGISGYKKIKHPSHH